MAYISTVDGHEIKVNESAKEIAFEIAGQGKVSGGRGKAKQPKKDFAFKRDEGQKKMIEEYKAIKQGTCKKGKKKQARIIARIKQWVEQGFLEKKI